MSGIYQKNVDSESVVAPSAGRTLISVNDLGELFTKDSSGNVSITQPKYTLIGNLHLINGYLLLSAINTDPFDVEEWKSSYTVTFEDGTMVNGVYESVGDFSTENSYANIIGIITDGNDPPTKSVLISTGIFKTSGGSTLNAIEDYSSVTLADITNFDGSYRYEEDPDATGSNPKYIHDFRLTIGSTQILGYVVINADDSESHNFIIDDPSA